MRGRFFRFSDLPIFFASVFPGAVSLTFQGISDKSTLLFQK